MKRPWSLSQAVILLGKPNKTLSAFWATKTKERENMGCKDCKKDGTLARGLGDTLARVINNWTGIEPCDGCDKRKEKLNSWFPYRDRTLDT